jgi:hypothetical protein
MSLWFVRFFFFLVYKIQCFISCILYLLFLDDVSASNKAVKVRFYNPSVLKVF